MARGLPIGSMKEKDLLAMRLIKQPEVYGAAIMQDGESHLFLWSKKGKREMFSFPGHYAACPDINLDWYHAAKVSEKIRNTTEPLCDVVAIGERTNG